MLCGHARTGPSTGENDFKTGRTSARGRRRFNLEIGQSRARHYNVRRPAVTSSRARRRDAALKLNPPLGNESYVVNEYGALSLAMHTKYLEHLINFSELTELTADILALEKQVASEGGGADVGARAKKWQAQRESYAASRKKAEADRVRVSASRRGRRGGRSTALSRLGGMGLRT